MRSNESHMMDVTYLVYFNSPYMKLCSVWPSTLDSQVAGLHAVVLLLNPGQYSM